MIKPYEDYGQYGTFVGNAQLNTKPTKTNMFYNYSRDWKDSTVWAETVSMARLFHLHCYSNTTVYSINSKNVLINYN